MTTDCVFLCHFSLCLFPFPFLFHFHRSFSSSLTLFQTRNLYSVVLDRTFRLPVTTYVLRCMDKAGGFDAYLVNTKPHKIDSDIGMEIRALILTKLGVDPFRKQPLPILLPATEAGKFNVSERAKRIASAVVEEAKE